VSGSRAAIAAEFGIGAVALTANLGHAVLPAGGRLAANVGAAGAAVYIARRHGVGWDALGLDRDRIVPGLAAGLAAGAVLAAGIVAASRVPTVASRLVDERIAAQGRGRAAFELVARIPIETAMAEEVIFRGAMLGTAMAGRSVRSSLAASSALFGLWHVVPTVARFNGSALGAAVGSSGTSRIGAVAGVVVATALAGAAFGALRLRSRSVVAPVLAHAALNVATFGVARSLGRRASRVDATRRDVR
jgi:membrane protease YdiL (CAAX protease family)